MSHFSKVFSRLASARAQPMLRRYSGHRSTTSGSGQRNNTTTTDKKGNENDSSGNLRTRDLARIYTSDTQQQISRLDNNLIEMAKEIRLTWEALRTEYGKIQGSIRPVKWKIGMLLILVAGVGNSLLIWLVAEELSKIMQESQMVKTTEENLYEKLDKLAQETKQKHQQEASTVKKAEQ